MNFQTVMTEAAGLFKSKAFGGVSKESAMSALEKLKNAAEEAIGKVQQELREYQNKTAREMAELTSKNDKVTLELKNAQAGLEVKNSQLAQESGKLAALKEKLAAAKAVKTSQKVLENGNIQVRKVNNNGAVMTKETTADGKLLSYNVTTLDGAVRRTKFNPATGKPIKTYTNTTGDKVVDYNLDGKSISEKLVNAKKASKPVVVNKQVINGEAPQVVETYSNGNVRNVNYYPNGNRRSEVVLDAKNHKVSGKQYQYSSSNGKLETINEKFYDENCRVVKDVVENRYYKQTRNKVYFNNGMSGRQISKEIETKDGYKILSRYIKDENGVYTNKYETVIKYPKSSKIKSSKITYKSDYDPQYEVLNMRDGSKAIVKTDSNYNLTSVELVPRGGTPGAAQNKLLTRADAEVFAVENGLLEHYSDGPIAHFKYYPPAN